MRQKSSAQNSKKWLIVKFYGLVLIKNILQTFELIKNNLTFQNFFEIFVSITKNLVEIRTKERSLKI